MSRESVSETMTKTAKYPGKISKIMSKVGDTLGNYIIIPLSFSI